MNRGTPPAPKRGEPSNRLRSRIRMLPAIQLIAITGKIERRKRDKAGSEASCPILVAGLSREKFGVNAAGANTNPPCESAPVAAAIHAAASAGTAKATTAIVLQLSNGASSRFPAADA